MWRGTVGLEFQANLSPNFDLEPARSALIAGEQPWINSYMFNGVLALPVGTDRTFQPYLSAGVGGLTLRADSIPQPGGNDIRPDDSRWGGNVGAGVMTFAGNVGLRGDVRWFKGFGTGPILDPAAEAVGDRLLADLSFWRANVGLAFRW